MKKILAALLFCLGLVSAVSADTINPMSNTLADSTNVASSIMMRDSAGAVAVASISASSSTATGVVAGNFVGAYSLSQIQQLSGINGKIAMLITSPPTICVGTGTVASNGAWVYISTSVSSTLRPCGS